MEPLFTLLDLGFVSFSKTAKPLGAFSLGPILTEDVAYPAITYIRAYGQKWKRSHGQIYLENAWFKS